MTTLIETMRARAGVLPLLWYHRARLARSCIALDVPEPGFWGEADRRAAECGDGVVRVVWNGVAEWSTREVRNGPVALRSSAVAHDAYPHKTTARDVFTRAVRAIGDEEPLLMTTDGLVAETARYAVVWWEDDLLCAVDPALDVLPSVGLARLGRLVEIHWCRRERAALSGRPLAVVNAARGVVPVVALDGVSVDADARWDRLAEAFWPA